MTTGAARGGLLTNVVTAALPLAGSFAVSVLLAPYVGDANFGIYSLVMSVATLLLVVAKFGIHTATSRLVSEHENAAGIWIRAGLLLRLPLTAIVALAALGLAPWLGPAFTGASGADFAFMIASAVIIGASLFEMGGETLVGLGAFRTQLALRLIVLAMRLGALGFVRWRGLGIEAFLIGHALAQAVPAAVVLGGLAWRTRRDAGDIRAAVQRTWHVSLPLAFSSASFLIYSHTDRLMLGVFRDEAVVGQFAVARNVVDAALFPVVALTWSLRPALVRALRPQADPAVDAVLADGWRLSVVYAAAGVALLGSLGPALLRAIYGEGYAEAGQLLPWLVPVLALRGLGTVVFPALVAADAQRRYALWMGWTAAVNVAANLALIPAFGARGAIASTTIALIVLTAGGFAEMRRAVGGLAWSRGRSSHAVAVVSAAAVGGALWLWDPSVRSAVAVFAMALAGTVVLALVNLGPLSALRRRFHRERSSPSSS